VLRLERGDPDADDTPTWDVLNRSRLSVAINLKSAAGRDLVLELCEQADVLIEGFRPGVTERLGLGPDDAWQRNKRLVYARMTGYGQEGPLAPRAGHDINYVAVSGALWPLGRAGERPVPALNLVGDFGGGALFLVFGVLAAVFSAQRSGEGQIVDVSMVDGTASMMAMTHSFLNAGYWTEERGVNILDSGAHFYEVYETSDGGFVAIGAIEPKFYAELLIGLGLRDDDVPAQMDRSTWPAMKDRFTALFRTKSRDEWTEIFANRDACVTPVLSPSEAATHPYNTNRDVFTTQGPTQPNPAPRFSKTPGAITSSPRKPGSGTRTGLAAWGVSEERLEGLRAAGAFG
jgi:alpha-methylacyl-CoA racemase